MVTDLSLDTFANPNDDSGGDPGPGGSGNLQSALSDIASSLITSVAHSAAGAAQGAIEGTLNNAPRSNNTAPVPDVAAAAAKPAGTSFLHSSVFGVSAPILLLGGAALLYVLARR